MTNVKEELMWAHTLIIFERTALNLELRLGFVPSPCACDTGQGV